MSSYLSNLLTTTSTRYASLRNLLPTGEADGDTPDDTHICRVLRAYYTEKGRAFPPWLPPDPKAAPPPQVQQQNYGAPVGAGYGNLANAGSSGNKLTSLWDNKASSGGDQVDLQRYEPVAGCKEGSSNNNNNNQRNDDQYSNNQRNDNSGGSSNQSGAGGFLGGLMDKVNSSQNNNNNNQSNNNSGGSNNQSSGGGSFLDGLKDKVNSAAGGGRDSEKNEDMLDKGIDFVQERFMGQGKQDNESAIEQAKDGQIADFIRGQYKSATGSDFPIKDKKNSFN
ncbi:hypothetical protein VE04_00810 [Pseudogymnoascus sp. 24MN13]|nr:hypothetical protein VE04_00810 [Pseudogymnoascus sp. 24MN13]